MAIDPDRNLHFDQFILKLLHAVPLHLHMYRSLSLPVPSSMGTLLAVKATGLLPGQFSELLRRRL